MWGHAVSGAVRNYWHVVPILTILPLRGNVDTRVRKVMDGEYDAIVLAYAGLARLGLQAHITETFPLDVMLPAPGQGALGGAMSRR